MGKRFYKPRIEEAFLNVTEVQERTERQWPSAAVDTRGAQMFVSGHVPTQEPRLPGKQKIPGPDQGKYEGDILFFGEKKKNKNKEALKRGQVQNHRSHPQTSPPALHPGQTGEI